MTTESDSPTLANLYRLLQQANSANAAETQAINQRITALIETIGSNTLRALEAVNRQARLPSSSLHTSEDSVVHKTHFFLADLQQHIQRIDPHQWNLQPSWMRRLWLQWLGYIIPNLASAYDRWLQAVAAADDVINTSVECLRSHRQYLAQDMQRLQQTEDTLRPLLQALHGHIEGLQALDQHNHLQSDQLHDEQRFSLRQRVTDLQQVLEVNQQTVMSIQIIRKTHAQLIRAIELALQVSTTALHTAALLTQNQQQQVQTSIMLDKMRETGSSKRMQQQANIDLAKQQFSELHRTINQQLHAVDNAASSAATASA